MIPTNLIKQHIQKHKCSPLAVEANVFYYKIPLYQTFIEKLLLSKKPNSIRSFIDDVILTAKATKDKNEQ